MTMQTHNFIGYASGFGAGNAGCADGPPYFIERCLAGRGKLLYPEGTLLNKYARTAELCARLSSEVIQCIAQERFFTVLGGDHSCAIGTWSGAAHSLRARGELGLIWIDAHLDAHTPQTSPSGNIHGMPVSALLGYGHPDLTAIQDHLPKIKPENICLIGIRSYEAGEQDLMRQLNVRVFYIEEVLQRGFDAVFAEAYQQVTRHTAAYGLSLDIDAIDPQEAPGTGTPEKNGLLAKDIQAALRKYCRQDRIKKKLLGWEITEFNPHLDVNHQTEKLILALLENMLK